MFLMLKIGGIYMSEIKLKNSKKVKVDGTEYTIQRLPVREAIELRSQWQESELVMFEMILEHFVIEPRVSLDDFEDVITVEKLASEVLDYQYKSKGK